MSTSITPQERMDAAFDNYLALSDLLREDLLALLESESKSLHWRRNFIRVSAALIEGHAHCLREMCAVSFECVAPDISSKETKVLRSEKSFDADERIKLTLRAAYKLFGLQPAPNFGGPEWPRAKRVLKKRHLLMHPKTPSDLDIPDELWNELRADVIWLLEQLFNFISALQTKHGA
ncbi:MAG: hypothetical protein KKD25_11300 [Gammaproteobacteria bacterium]|jgi:hypothetical protein|nr:hypothetical protein [Gammaproteobacteria bacterium]MBU0856631.1 hypothetical protein [Gammaproteobacteria bacterium]MBU1846919.1 hypothetical protein [Gammaproteobacteria bacterium]